MHNKKPLNFKPVSIGFSELGFNEPWNILERHKQAEIVAQDVAKKLTKEAITKSREKEITAQTEATMYMAFARVLCTKWKELAKRETRLKVMFDAVEDLLRNTMTKPDKVQLEVEAEFQRQTNTKVTRLKVEPEEIRDNKYKGKLIANEVIKELKDAASKQQNAAKRQQKKMYVDKEVMLTLLEELVHNREEK